MDGIVKSMACFRVARVLSYRVGGPPLFDVAIRNSMKEKAQNGAQTWNQTRITWFKAELGSNTN